MNNIIVEQPPGSIAVNRQKVLTCTTNSANPPAQIVWMRDNQPVSLNIATSNLEGQFKAKTTTSSITIITTKDHNQAEYACVVKYRNSDITNLKRIATLDVTCEYRVPALINLIFY